MSCLGEELKLIFNAHVFRVGKVYKSYASNDFLYILLYSTLRTQVALIIELWVADVAYILN